MKAITLWQPWATLIAIGAKKIETRSWATKYRGPLAIHASKTVMNMLFLFDDRFQVPLVKAGYEQVFDLPTGSIVATCNLVDCIEMTNENIANLTEKERAFGDYQPGRFMWILDDVKQLEKPILAKGMQRIWEFKGEIP